VEIEPAAVVARIIAPEFGIPEKITLPYANLPIADIGKNLLPAIPAITPLAPGLCNLALISHQTSVAAA
jgi:hypothetical protein